MAALLVTIAKMREGGGEALGRYAAGVMPLLEAAGAEILTRAQPLELMIGAEGSRPDLVAVMRFSSADAIRTFLTSEAYRKNEVHRNRAFSEVHTYIAADLMPARN